MSEKLYEVTRGLWIDNRLLERGTQIEEGVGTSDQIAAWLRSGAIRSLEPIPDPEPAKSVEPLVIRAGDVQQDASEDVPAGESSLEEVNDGNDNDSIQRRKRRFED